MQFLQNLLKTAIISAVAVFSSLLSGFLVLLFLIGLGVGIGIAAGAAGSEISEHSFHYGNELSENVILSVPITGLILGDRDLSSDLDVLFSSASLTYGYEIYELLMEEANNEKVVALLLEVDSPGGTIYGSNAIAEGVEYFRKQTGRPVIAHIAGVAASGGYWAAASADKIYADMGTTIGSIGVIFGPFKYYDGVVSEDGGAFIGGVVTSGGVETQYITAGTSKDIGNPYRRVTEQELAQLQESVNDSYDEFVAFVAERRGMQESVVREHIGAQVYGDSQAEKLNLIDGRTGAMSMYHTIADDLELDDFQVVRASTDGGFFDGLFADSLLGSLQQLVARMGSGGSVGSQQSGSLSQVNRGCPLSNQVLVFHGDVNRLCF